MVWSVEGSERDLISTKSIGSCGSVCTECDGDG